MTDVFSKQVKDALDAARLAARARGHTELEPEHVLLGLLADVRSTAGWCFSHLRVDLERLRRKCEALVEAIRRTEYAGDPRFSALTKRVFQRAMELSLLIPDRHVGTEHFAVALAEAADSRAQPLLAELGADVASLRAEMSKLPAEKRVALG